MLQIWLIAGQGAEVGEEAEAEHGDADQQSRAEEQRAPRDFQERRRGEERDEQPEGGDREGGEVFVHRGAGLLEDGDDVEGHHGEERGQEYRGWAPRPWPNPRGPYRIAAARAPGARRPRAG